MNSVRRSFPPKVRFAATSGVSITPSRTPPGLRRPRCRPDRRPRRSRARRASSRPGKPAGGVAVELEEHVSPGKVATLQDVERADVHPLAAVVDVQELLGEIEAEAVWLREVVGEQAGRAKAVRAVGIEAEDALKPELLRRRNSP